MGHVGVAVGRTRCEDLLQVALEPRVLQGHVDEAGVGDLDAREEAILGQALDDGLGDRRGRLLGGLGEGHGHVGREVAELGVAGLLDGRLCRGLGGQRALLDRPAQGLGDGVGDEGPDGGSRISHGFGPRAFSVG
ncbi:hypothetical protein D3C86_1216510 [compost metagenome]